MMSSSEGTSHCWVCDEHGDVYFSPNIAPSLPTSTHPQAHTQQWTYVDNSFDSIAAGFCGVVCAIKDSALYIRKGVTSIEPMGTEWDQHFCDVVLVLVGKKCIVRKSSLGVLYYTKLTLRSLLVGLLEWMAVGSFVEPTMANASSDASLHHYAIDVHDRLYGLTRSGGVACYKLLEEEPCWNVVAQPPPRPQSASRAGQLVGWLSSIWRSRGDGDTSSGGGGDGSFVSKVSIGMGSVWCLMEGHREVWQLVVSELKHSTKWNWVRSDLPLDKDGEVLHFQACKSSVDRLYVAIRNRGLCKVLSYSLNSKDNGRCEVVYPSKHPCRSLAIAVTIRMNPKLCCEDGSCSFCIKNIFSARKRINEIDSHAVGAREKRARLDSRSHLLNGVQFHFNQSFLTQRYDVRHHVPLIDESIMNKVTSRVGVSVLILGGAKGHQESVSRDTSDTSQEVLDCHCS